MRTKVATLFVREQPVMGSWKGLPTDTADTIDEYNRRSRGLMRRADPATATAQRSEDDRHLTAELEEGKTVVVRRDGKVVHRIVLGEDRQRFRADQLLSWNGHWLLEFDGDVILDGESLKKRGGYAEVFDWMLVGGEPFFFFVKDGRTGISHRGEVLALTYDHVLHGGCCEPAAYNPQSTSWGVRFHARRGVTWFYVEISTFE